MDKAENFKTRSKTY